MSKSANEIYANLKASFLASQNKLSEIDEPGVLYAIFQAAAEELASLYSLLDSTIDRAYLDTATGQDLDKIGALVGCTRKAGTKATGTLRFSRSTPADRDYLIPAGTRARTPLQPDKTYLSFQTTQDAVLTAGSTYVDVPAESVDVGAKYNVASDKIIILETKVSGVTAVTNPSAFSGGTDPESDEDYRARIPLYLQSLKRATADALKSAALSVSGVADAIVEDGATPGTVTITVVGSTGPVDSATLTAVEQAIDEYKGAGIIPTVQSATTVSVSSTFDLYVLSGYDSATVQANAEQAVTDYLNALSLGSPAQIAEVIAEIMKIEGVDNVKNVVLFIDGEMPSGTVDGVNTSFTLLHTPIKAGSVSLLVDGTTTITDNGDGTLSDGGTIDYTTGAVNLVSAPTTSIIADYQMADGDVMPTSTEKIIAGSVTGTVV